MAEEDNFFKSIVKNGSTSSAAKFEDCFQLFDSDKDGFLNKTEFQRLLQRAFDDSQIDETKTLEFLKVLDKDKDGKINKTEFETCWFHWLKQVFDPKTALIVVDVQNDFIDGTLAIKKGDAKQEGSEVIPVINKMLDEINFDFVVYSKDWHPKDHISFVENVSKRPLHKRSAISNASEAKELDIVVFDGDIVMEQKLWPAHCIQSSWGAELHKDLKVVDNSININKGTNPNIDSYSAFWDNKMLSQTGLVNELTKRGITDVYVCGLAYDVCVSSTAIHSIEHGFRTLIVEDACRGLKVNTINQMKDRFLRKGGMIIQSWEVQPIAGAKKRPVTLGYQAALNIAMAKNLVMTDSRKPNGTKS
ncbi:DgyrCDS1805 [Dimorphilus gyrociliatus]|uniref:nicotinamidase n=1 Tax=Dimorphilus gyrociliatus TaxID=2664684 RepID=A0A7I8V8H3_9ANNE|nr:DgyrCDS1805 [Dimorphilus gyrociliatus]